MPEKIKLLMVVVGGPVSIQYSMDIMTVSHCGAGAGLRMLSSISAGQWVSRCCRQAGWGCVVLLLETVQQS